MRGTSGTDRSRLHHGPVAAAGAVALLPLRWLSLVGVVVAVVAVVFAVVVFAVVVVAVTVGENGIYADDGCNVRSTRIG